MRWGVNKRYQVIREGKVNVLGFNTLYRGKHEYSGSSTKKSGR